MVTTYFRLFTKHINSYATIGTYKTRKSLAVLCQPKFKCYRMASTMNNSTGRELRIQIPYGDIAALEWGPPDGVPVLALHGWQDNALSFHPLIPHLPPNLRVVAIDFPGHGLSAHYGPGATYSHFSYLNNVFQVAKWLKWDKFNIIAHSLGAMVGIQFAAYYPEKLERLVTLDIMYPQVEVTLAFGADSFPTMLKMHTQMEIRQKSPPIEITWDDAVAAFSRDRKISKENLLMLLSRSVRPGSTEDRWVLTRDHRIRVLNVPKVEFTEPATVMKMMENYRGSWLAIMAKEDDEVSPKKLEREKQMKERYQNLKLFRVERVKSSHFVHIEQPEIVGKLISDLFIESKAKL